MTDLEYEVGRCLVARPLVLSPVGDGRMEDAWGHRGETFFENEGAGRAGGRRRDGKRSVLEEMALYSLLRGILCPCLRQWRKEDSLRKG